MQISATQHTYREIGPHHKPLEQGLRAGSSQSWGRLSRARQGCACSADLEGLNAAVTICGVSLSASSGLLSQQQFRQLCKYDTWLVIKLREL